MTPYKNYICILSLIIDIHSPPGIIHPLLVEHFSWVDTHLRELYYKEINYNEINYNEINYNEPDEYQDNCLLQKKWLWCLKKSSSNNIINPILENIPILENNNILECDGEYDDCDYNEYDYDICEYDDCDYKIKDTKYDDKNGKKGKVNR